MTNYDINLDINPTGQTVQFAGKTYTLNAEFTAPAHLTTATDPLTGNEVPIYTDAEECCAYLRKKLGVENITFEENNPIPWASEYCATSVSILLEGLVFGSILLQA